MKIGSKVFIDKLFKDGYVISYDNYTFKYKVVCFENGGMKFYDMLEEELYLMK